MKRKILISLFFIFAYISQLLFHTQARSFAATVSLFCLLICTALLPIPFLYKLIFFTCILYIGRINFHLYSTFFILLYRGQKSDIIARENIYNVLLSHFDLEENLYTLPKFPTIIVSNYCYDRAENLVPIIMPRPMAFIALDKFVRYTRVDRVLENIIIRSGGDSNSGEYDNMKNKIKDSIRNGKFVFSYVGRCCKQIGVVSKLRTGMFHIAQELGIGITPVYIDYFKLNQGIIVPQKFRIIVEKTFFIQNKEEIQNRIDSVRDFFMKKIREKTSINQ